jgi:prepilin-type N-terminal cleavage/methylation domain-containing protein
MRSSAPNTERRSTGVTLLEVIIAVTIFSIVSIVALTTMNEGTDAARLSTIQADLRRVGEKALNDIVKDVRSS